MPQDGIQFIDEVLKNFTATKPAHWLISLLIHSSFKNPSTYSSLSFSKSSLKTKLQNDKYLTLFFFHPIVVILFPHFVLFCFRHGGSRFTRRKDETVRSSTSRGDCSEKLPLYTRNGLNLCPLRHCRRYTAIC